MLHYVGKLSGKVVSHIQNPASGRIIEIFYCCVPNYRRITPIVSVENEFRFEAIYKRKESEDRDGSNEVKRNNGITIRVICLASYDGNRDKKARQGQ